MGAWICRQCGEMVFSHSPEMMACKCPDGRGVLMTIRQAMEQQPDTLYWDDEPTNPQAEGSPK